MVDLLKRLLPGDGGAGGWMPATSRSESAPEAVVPRPLLGEAPCFLLGHYSVASGWHAVVPIRRVLVRDPLGQFEPQGWFVQRWPIEVTFQEARARLGGRRNIQ